MINGVTFKNPTGVGFGSVCTCTVGFFSFFCVFLPHLARKSIFFARSTAFERLTKPYISIVLDIFVFLNTNRNKVKVLELFVDPRPPP